MVNIECTLGDRLTIEPHVRGSNLLTHGI